MATSILCSPNTFAERQNFSQCNGLDSLFSSRMSGNSSPFSMACESTAMDAFSTYLNEDLQLDRPLALALARQHAASSPDQAVMILVASVPEDLLPKSEKVAEASFDSLFGGGNIPGNVTASTEAALRAAWKRQAMNGFKALLSGAQNTAIRIGPHITIEPRNIGKGGELRKGARMMVRIKGLPMTVIHSLPAPIMSKAGGEFASIRVGARDLVRMEQAGSAIANARFNSMSVLRGTATRVGGGVLAFGPSAAIDMYNSARIENGTVAVDWRGFALKSARSQSGNVVGVMAGAGAVAGATALGIVAAVGWPVVLVGLGAGLVAQIAWGSFGRDEWAETQVKRVLDK